MVAKNERLNVVVLDDHPIVARGIADIVKDMDCVGGVSAGVVGDALKSNALYIVDLELGENSGLDEVNRLLEQSDAKVLVYTMHEEPWVKCRVRTLGVDGAVSKNESIEQLRVAVEQIARGDSYFSPVFTDGKDRWMVDVRYNVSARERQVLHLLCEGLTSAAISERLNVSINTVQTYRRRVMEKFGVNNVAELVVQAKGLF